MYFHPTSDRMITSCLKHQPGRLRGYAFTMLIGDDQLSVGKLHSGWFLFVFYIAKGTEDGRSASFLAPRSIRLS